MLYEVITEKMMTYIPSCEDEIRFLKSYDPTKYQNPGFAADTALFAVGEDALKILLINRGNYPYKGCSYNFV